MNIRRPSTKSPARMKHAEHTALWNAVEGAVVDAFRHHPDCLTDKGRRSFVESITKRVVGSVRSALADGRVSGCKRPECRQASGHGVVHAAPESRPWLGPASVAGATIAPAEPSGARRGATG